MRGMKALLAAVIVMGIAIVLGTGVLVATVVHRALHSPPMAAAAPASPSGTGMSMVTLDEPAGTRIVSVIRQSDTALAVTLSGGGGPDRLRVWDLPSGRIVATLRLSP